MQKAFSRLALAVLLALAALPTPAVRAEAPPDPRFGIVESFWMPEEATWAGAGWQRVIFYWNSLQPTGPQDWNGAYFPEDHLNRENRERPIVGLLIGTPAWARDGGDVRTPPKNLALPFDHPENAWGRFVRRIVDHYKGRIDTWIVWNEPDVWGSAAEGSTWTGTEAEYYQLLKVAYLSAKSANPQAKVLFAGLTYWWDAQFGRRDYLDRVLEIAASDETAAANGFYFDVLPLHLYNVVPYVRSIPRFYQKALAKYGLKKPIWINEMNAIPYDDPTFPLPAARGRVTLVEQAAFVVQASAVALAAGVERVELYKITDDLGLKPGGEPFGLVRRDRTRRPALAAFRAITHAFKGCGGATERIVDGVRSVTLDCQDRTVHVLWNETPADLVALVQPGEAGAALIDQTGRAEPIVMVDGRIQVPLGRATANTVEGAPDFYTVGGPTKILTLPK